MDITRHPSADVLQNAFFASISKPAHYLPAIQFCDNEKDTNECLNLVLQGVKTATATSVWEFELNAEALPKVGDRYIVTDWHGVAHCVIETTKLTRLRFADITAEHAYLEGEGDKSLSYWQDVHKAYYQRQFQGSQYAFNNDMEIVFEEFKVVFVLLPQ